MNKNIFFTDKYIDIDGIKEALTQALMILNEVDHEKCDFVKPILKQKIDEMSILQNDFKI